MVAWLRLPVNLDGAYVSVHPRPYQTLAPSEGGAYSNLTALAQAPGTAVHTMEDAMFFLFLWECHRRAQGFYLKSFFIRIYCSQGHGILWAQPAVKGHVCVCGPIVARVWMGVCGSCCHWRLCGCSRSGQPPESLLGSEDQLP